MANTQPSAIQHLIPKTIEKGCYARRYKRRDGTSSIVWWVKLYGRNSEPIYESTHSSRYEDAVKLKKKLIAQIENDVRAGGDVDSIRIPELLDDWLEISKAADETKKVYKYTIESNLKPFFRTTKVSRLTTDKINAYRKSRVAEIAAKKNPTTLEARKQAEKAANVTVNRDLCNLRSALRYGMKLTPPKVMRVPHFEMAVEDNARQGFLEQDLYAKLRDAFKDPAVRLLFIVGYNIGCRSGELRAFEWDMVDLNEGVIRLPGRITKNGKPRTVPIFEGDCMESLKAEKAQHDDFYAKSKWVFSRVGKRIKRFDYEWRVACERAGCPDLMFHDLRRTAVRNMVRIHGLDRQVAKKISGHLTDSMFDRYDIIDEQDIKAAKRKVDANGTAPQVSAPGFQSSSLPSELLSKLSSIPKDKLTALIALLGA